MAATMAAQNWPKTSIAAMPAAAPTKPDKTATSTSPATAPTTALVRMTEPPMAPIP